MLEGKPPAHCCADGLMTGPRLFFNGTPQTLTYILMRHRIGLETGVFTPSPAAGPEPARTLVVDDDPDLRTILGWELASRGYAVGTATDGEDACSSSRFRTRRCSWCRSDDAGTGWRRSVSPPPARSTRLPTYVILLTCRTAKQDIIAGLARAPTITSPSLSTLRNLVARLEAGHRVLVEQERLRREALALHRPPPPRCRTCWPCAPIATHAVEADRWLPLEEFLLERFGTQCSHGICPACFATFVKPELDEMEER